MQETIIKRDNVEVVSANQQAVVRQALIDIANENDGRLLPEIIVQTASDPTNLLHEYFEWDNTEAAEKFRLLQAGMLVRRVKLNIIREDKKTKQIRVETTRAFRSLPSCRGTVGYETLEIVMTNDDKKAELLAAALAELESTKERYEDLNELKDLWDLVEVKKKTLKK